MTLKSVETDGSSVPAVPPSSIESEVRSCSSELHQVKSCQSDWVIGTFVQRVRHARVEFGLEEGEEDVEEEDRESV